jgi:hypothetical protein
MDVLLENTAHLSLRHDPTSCASQALIRRRFARGNEFTLRLAPGTESSRDSSGSIAPSYGFDGLETEARFLPLHSVRTDSGALLTPHPTRIRDSPGINGTAA